MCFPYLLNYITSLYWKLSENYKHGCRNDQPICKNKGCNESNKLSSNDLRFFQNNLGLVFHTTYSCIFHSCIFHPCDLLLLFPLPHFQSVGWNQADLNLSCCTLCLLSPLSPQSFGMSAQLRWVIRTIDVEFGSSVPSSRTWLSHCWTWTWLFRVHSDCFVGSTTVKTNNEQPHYIHESPLPLTDPRRRGSAHAKYSVCIASYGNQTISFIRPSCWKQISTVGVINSCQRPSEVYDTHRRTKLTAPETISRSRDMVLPTKILMVHVT